MIPLSRLQKLTDKPVATTGDAAPSASQSDLAAHDKRFHDGHYEGGECKYRTEHGIPTTPAKKNSTDVKKSDTSAETRKPTAAEEYVEAVEKDRKAKEENDSPAKLDEKYFAAIEKGDLSTAEKMVRKAAEKAGYTYEAYHIGMFGEDQGSYVPAVDGSTSPDQSLGMHFGTRDAAFIRARRWLNEDKVEFNKGKDGKWHYSTENEFISDLYPKDNAFDTKEQAELDALKTFRGCTLHHVMIDLGQSTRMTDNEANIIDEETAKKYDTVVYANEYEDKGKDSVMILKSNLAKSVDTITYDDSGKPIPLSKRFSTDNPDIRY